MKRHNNGISEEHVVAYLDGELNVNGEMREALSDAEIRHAANEHAALKKIIASSALDSRFRLGADLNARTVAYLQNILRSRKSGQLADAEPVRTTRTVETRTKYFWAKRTSIGIALAMLLGLLWFVAKPTDNTSTPVAINKPQVQEPAAPTVSQPAPEAVADASSKGTVATPDKESVAAIVKHVPKKNAQVTNIAAETPAVKSQEIASHEEPAAPADVMISRRYAKLIKDVRVVEVTQQDKM